MADSFKLGAPLVLSVCQTLLSSGGHFQNGILLLLFYLRHMTCMKSGGGAGGIVRSYSCREIVGSFYYCADIA